ncbi:uncharacterized protein LAJ45_01004 [Morchella importuna]|uniref:uncharacterized protein n=1 Tax=Morchella importuna TaxID=1174673 RepID=UPI001E8EE462|nr:uncharacterized protein LAJ45_01004 [Morchella importuna]KAH8154477.1 hypothetical protein LAJ45_01004 [Morchella importuna]
MGLDTRSTSPSIVSEKESLSAPIQKLLSELDGQKACAVDEINILPAGFPQSHADVPALQSLRAEPVPIMPGAPSDLKVLDLAGKDEVREPDAAHDFPGGGDLYHKIGLVPPKTRDVRGSFDLEVRPHKFSISQLLLPTKVNGVTNGGTGASLKSPLDHEFGVHLPEASVTIPHSMEVVADTCPAGVSELPGLEEVRSPLECEKRWDEYAASIILDTPKKEWMIKGMESWGNSLYDASVKKASGQKPDRRGHEIPIPGPPQNRGADKDIVEKELRGEYKPNILETNQITTSTSSTVEKSTVGLGNGGISDIHSNLTVSPQTTVTEQNEHQDAKLSREGGVISPRVSLNNLDKFSVECLLKTLLEKELRKYGRAEVSSAGTLLMQPVNQVESCALKEESHGRENIIGGTVLCGGDHGEPFEPLEESESQLQRSSSEERLQPFENIVGGTLWYRDHHHEPSTLSETQVSPAQSYPDQKRPKRFANILDTFSCQSELWLRGLGGYDKAQVYQGNDDSPLFDSVDEGLRETPQVDGTGGDSSENDPPASTDGNSTIAPTGGEGGEFPSILIPSADSPGGESSIPSNTSSCDSEEEDTPPPMPLYSDEALNEYLKDMDEIYENIKVNDRLLKSLVRQVFDGEITMSKFRENAYVSKGAKRVYSSLEENSADVKALLTLLENKLAMLTEKQKVLVKLIVGEINPHTGGYWANHTRLEVPGVPIDNPRLPKQPYYG